MWQFFFCRPWPQLSEGCFPTIRQPSGTMSLGISRVTSSLKCAPMSVVNQFCRRWEVRPSTICLHIKRIMQDRTSEQEDSGDLPINAFFDIKVFNFNVQSYRRSSLESCYKREETKKMRAYEQRILAVEHGTLLHLCSVPLVAGVARTFYTRLAHLLFIKRQTSYARDKYVSYCTY